MINVWGEGRQRERDRGGSEEEERRKREGWRIEEMRSGEGKEDGELGEGGSG
jgi:hypothetical protein